MQLFGVIKNANTGEPIPRATITVKSPTGDITQQFPANDLGSFTYDANGLERLYFTAVGYAPIDVPTAYYQAGQTINITMFPVTSNLPAVTVTAGSNKNYLWWLVAAAIVGKMAKLY